MVFAGVTASWSKVRLAVVATAGVVAVFAVLALVLPRNSDEPPGPPINPAWISSGDHRRTELYFGSRRAQGPPVSDGQFDAFVDNHIVPRFPDGFIRLAGERNFTSSAGPMGEGVFVVILLYRLDDRDADRQIEAIRDDYKRLFRQGSVMRADSLDRVSH
jgi:hypothetical protein